jgi:hypothetical protein
VRDGSLPLPHSPGLCLLLVGRRMKRKEKQLGTFFPIAGAGHALLAGCDGGYINRRITLPDFLCITQAIISKINQRIKVSKCGSSCSVSD